MKYLILGFFFLISINNYGQENTTLYFRNGDSLKVKAYLNSGSPRITYRENEDAKRITVDYKKAEKAVQHYNEFDKTFVFKIKNGYTIPVLLERAYSGKAYLYKMDFTRNSSFAGGMTMSSNHSEYYVCKYDADVVTTFNASGLFIENGFRKKSTEFFKDCPELVNKINDKIWKMKDITEIVHYYDTECN
tara:strand:+ start:1109 stop:1678 length:570 start_codon:yes stop_codon:yes gene_type:complete